VSWTWRKSDRRDKSLTDPQIQNARRILQDGRKSAQDARTDEHTDRLPGAIDSDFCYEEDDGPCA